MKLFTLTVLMVFLASCAGPHKSASFSISEVQDDCETSTIGDKLFGLGLEFAVFAISGLHGTVEFQSSVKSQSEFEGLVRQEDCDLATRREAERRGSIQFAHHHALLNLGNLLGCHCQTKRGGKRHLLLVKPRHAFQRLIDVGLNTNLHGWLDLLTLPP